MRELPDTTRPEVVRAILRSDADLDLLLAGEGFDTWAVGDTLVVKFPKTEADARKLEIELATHPVMNERLGAIVPEIRMVGDPDERFPWIHLGFAPACGRQAQSMDGTTIVGSLELADDLGRLLSRLHDTDVERARACGVGGRRIPSSVPEPSDATVDRLDALAGGAVTRFLSKPVPPASTARVLCHTDLKGEHVFVADGMETVTSIIDWADVEVSDPAMDLAGLVIWLGPTLVGRVARAYGSTDVGIVERAVWLARAGLVRYWDGVLNGTESAPLPLITAQLRIAFEA
jgi:aminoglycoside phosphotransferase (APT) family kinase protein